MIAVHFVDVGRNKATFTVEMRELSFLSLHRAVRGKLASSCIDFSVDDEARTGVVHAGFHDVGAFTWTEAVATEPKP